MAVQNVVYQLRQSIFDYIKVTFIRNLSLSFFLGLGRRLLVITLLKEDMTSVSTVGIIWAKLFQKLMLVPTIIHFQT